MDWIKVEISTAPEGIEPLCGRLYQIGITGVEIEDGQEFESCLKDARECPELFDSSLVESKKGKSCVKVYVSDNIAGHETLKLILQTLREMKRSDEQNIFGSLEVATENISEEDWANNWKKYFKPLPVGEKILIKPEWESINEDCGRIVFTVNPGMAFGTGTHETTRMCICMLEKYVFPGSSILDIGCGSGILSVISILLGANNAVAVDIDPNCEKIAAANAAANGVGPDKYTVYTGDILSDDSLKAKLPRFDIVVANIVADVIVRLAGDVKNYLKKDGIFICSGIIDFRENDVTAALEKNGFDIIGTAGEGEWAAIAAKLRR